MDHMFAVSAKSLWGFKIKISISRDTRGYSSMFITVENTTRRLTYTVQPYRSLRKPRISLILCIHNILVTLELYSICIDAKTSTDFNNVLKGFFSAKHNYIFFILRTIFHTPDVRRPWIGYFLRNIIGLCQCRRQSWWGWKRKIRM